MLIEAVVASALVLAVVGGLGSAFSLALKSSLSDTANIQSALLCEEGLEAVRILRDNSWSTHIAPKVSGTAFYLSFYGDTWTATSSNVRIDGFFERSVTLFNVYRDSSQNIVPSGGTLDANTKLAVVSVFWRDRGATSTRSLSTYITNIFDN